MSQSAKDINAALQLYRVAQGTEHEADAFANLQATVARVREEQCCGGRCRFCPVWRSK